MRGRRCRARPRSRIAWPGTSATGGSTRPNSASASTGRCGPKRWPTWSGSLSDMPAAGAERHSKSVVGTSARCGRSSSSGSRLALKARANGRTGRRSARCAGGRCRWIQLFVGVLVGAVIVSAHADALVRCLARDRGDRVLVGAPRTAMGSHHDQSHHGDSRILADHRRRGPCTTGTTGTTGTAY